MVVPTAAKVQRRHRAPLACCGPCRVWTRLSDQQLIHGGAVRRGLHLALPQAAVQAPALDQLPMRARLCHLSVLHSTVV